MPLSSFFSPLRPPSNAAMHHRERLVLCADEIRGLARAIRQRAAETFLISRPAAVPDALADHVAHLTGVEAADDGTAAAEGLAAIGRRPLLGHFDDDVGVNVARGGADPPCRPNLADLDPRYRAFDTVYHHLPRRLPFGGGPNETQGGENRVRRRGIVEDLGVQAGGRIIPRLK